MDSFVGEGNDSFMREYDDLPESIKFIYSFKEYSMLPESVRASIVTEECEPEWEE